VFGNTGQDCCARSRVFVERPAYDDFVSAMAARTDTLTVGPPLEDGTDLGRAIRVSKGIRTGVISVNSSHSVHTEAPFGGYKRSGIGREMGMHAVNLYTEVKNVFFAES